MKITPPANDVNTQGLKGINRASGEVTPTDHVEPGPAIEAEERHWHSQNVENISDVKKTRRFYSIPERLMNNGWS